ncbi:hypothetical protein ABTA54_19960, partial [Acinetobacter baumannii]
LKTLRKKNASVIFATQSLADIDGSSIAPAIIESCPNRILLPNDREPRRYGVAVAAARIDRNRSPRTPIGNQQSSMHSKR